jgi:hypothetical protein
MDAARWAKTAGELARLRLLNLLGGLGELGVLGCDDQQAAQASGLSGEDLSAAWRFLQLRRLVVFESGNPSGPGGAVMLSGEGVLGYRARLRRLADPAATRWTVRSALLDWLMTGRAGDFRCLTEFQSDPRSVLEGMRPAGLQEVQAAAAFLADRGLVELIDTDGSRLMKVRIAAAGRNLAAQVEQTGRALSALDVNSGVDIRSRQPAGTAAQDRLALSADEAKELARFLDRLRSLISVDDMPAERRTEMLGLVDRLGAAARHADRAALRRCWERARPPLQAAGPYLASYIAGLPAILCDPPAASTQSAPRPPIYGQGTT